MSFYSTGAGRRGRPGDQGGPCNNSSGAFIALIAPANQVRLGQYNGTPANYRECSHCSLTAQSGLCLRFVKLSFTARRVMTGDWRDSESDNWHVRQDKFVSNWTGLG